MFKSSDKLAQFTIIHKNSNCYKDYHILKINTTLLMHKTDDVNWNRIQKGMFIIVHSWAVMRKTKLCIAFYYLKGIIIVHLIVVVNTENYYSQWEFYKFWKIFNESNSTMLFINFVEKCSFDKHFHQKRFNGSFKWKFRYRIRSWKDIRIDISAYMVLHYC